MTDRRSKDQLAQAAGLVTYDTALPQDWVDRCCAITGHEAPRYNIVWSYDHGTMFGVPIGLDDPARALLDEFAPFDPVQS